MEKKYIIKLQNKDFVTHEGLLNEFHQNKGKSISTEILRNDAMVLFKAVVSGEKGEFTAHGDADEKNVNRMIKPHMLRMAETRAINRALRLYNNIGMCSAEELGESSTTEKKESKSEKKPANQNEVAGCCAKCGADITEGVLSFSMGKFKEPVCMDCQKK